jgi:virulence-associated protein VagC
MKVGSAIKTVKVVQTEGGQLIRLPDEFRFSSPVVSVRREGEAVILEPIKPARWPDGFFEAIRVDDPSFERPPQGGMPPAPKF